MTFYDLISKQNLTIYSLSKQSGIPKTTLFDIATSKTNILDCTGRTLQALSKTLNISIDDILNLDKEETKNELPEFLSQAISMFRTNLRDKSAIVKVYLTQLRSCIDLAEKQNLITLEKANELRERYNDNILK